MTLTLCLCAGHASYRFTTKNLTEVIPGELYRSAQIGRDDLVAFKERYGIRSVPNLRGAQSGKDWYREEIAASAELGWSMPISGCRPTSRCRTTRPNG